MRPCFEITFYPPMADIAVEKILEVQGDRVLVFQQREGEISQNVLTLVHVVDTDSRSLRMVNRDSKTKLPDYRVSESLLAALKPARKNKENAKWEVTLKPK